MEKNRVKGKTKDIAGRAQRQVGEWTGDEKNQAKGAVRQVEGNTKHLGKSKGCGEEAWRIGATASSGE